MKSASSKTPNMRYGVSFLNTNYNDKAVADESVMDKKSGEIGYRRKIDDSFIYFNRENVDVDNYMRDIKTLLKNDLNIKIPRFNKNSDYYFITSNIDLRSKNINYFGEYEYRPIISSPSLIYDWKIDGKKGTIINDSAEVVREGIHLFQTSSDDNTGYVEYELYSPIEGTGNIVIYLDSVSAPANFAYEVNDGQWGYQTYIPSMESPSRTFEVSGLYYGKNTFRIRYYGEVSSPVIIKSVGFDFNDSSIESIISHTDGKYYLNDSTIYGDNSHYTIDNVEHTVTAEYNKAFYDDENYMLYMIYSPFNTDARFIVNSESEPVGTDEYYLSVNINDEKLTDDSLNWRKTKLNTEGETFVDIRLRKGINFIKISASANKDSANFVTPGAHITVTWNYFKLYFKFPISVSVPITLPRVSELPYIFAKLNVNPRFLPHLSFIQQYGDLKLKMGVKTDLSDQEHPYITIDAISGLNEINSFIITPDITTEGFVWYDEIKIGFDEEEFESMIYSDGVSSEDFTKFINTLEIFLNDSFENLFPNLEISTFLDIKKNNSLFIKNPDITPLILMTGYNFNKEMDKVGRLADQRGVRSSVEALDEFEWDDTSLWLEKIRDIQKDVKYEYVASGYYLLQNELYHCVDPTDEFYNNGYGFFTKAPASKSFYRISINTSDYSLNHILVSDTNTLNKIKSKIDDCIFEEVENNTAVVEYIDGNSDSHTLTYRGSYTAYDINDNIIQDYPSYYFYVQMEISLGNIKPKVFTSIKETFSASSFEELEDYLSDPINVTGSITISKDPEGFYAEGFYTEEEVGE